MLGGINKHIKQQYLSILKIIYEYKFLYVSK